MKTLWIKVTAYNNISRVMNDPLFWGNKTSLKNRSSHDYIWYILFIIIIFVFSFKILYNDDLKKMTLSFCLFKIEDK